MKFVRIILGIIGTVYGIIVVMCKSIGYLLLLSIAIPFFQLWMVVGCIYRHWKGCLIFFLIALLVIVGIMLPWYVIRVFLPLIFALAIVVVLVVFWRRIFPAFPNYITERWAQVRKKGFFTTIQTWEHRLYTFIRRNWTVSGTILMAVVLFVVILHSTLPWVESVQQKPQLTEWGECFSKIVFPALGVLGVIVTVLKTLSEILKQSAARQFNNTMEYLESDRQALVLAGVLTLNNLAMSFSENYTQSVHETFCNFIREVTSNPQYQEDKKRE